MEVKFTRSKWGTILGGVLAIVLGILLFANFNTAPLTITIFVGWALVIFGIASLISAATNWSVLLSTADLYNGLISLLFGVLILMAPGFFVAWIFILLGFYIIFAGFAQLTSANAGRVMGIKGAGWGIVAAIVTIVLGFMVVTSPFAMASATIILCGVALVYSGITHIIEGIKMPKSQD